jgi:sugar transferase (PEP-CTERM/EpsH1 system associated)
MRIFMLVSRVPWPLEKGDKLRAYHQLKHLARHHEVYLCCLSDGKIHPDALNQLKTITPHVSIIRLNRLLILWRLLLALFSSKPFQVNYFFERRASRMVNRMISEFKPDHIYCQLIRTSEYVKNLHHIRKTIDFMDALSAGLQRRAAGASFLMKFFVVEEARRLRNYEHLIFDYFDHHTIISEQDQQLILHPERNKIVIVPNGIDTTFFAKRNTSEAKFDLVFTGNMSYPPNVDCALRIAREIMPKLLLKRPGVRLLIAGANPIQVVRQLRSPAIEVTGWMDDIRDAYGNARIFIAPMRTGSGLQNKLLEAMAMELPCITSTLVAGAMRAENRKHLIIEDDNDRIVGQILALLDDPSLAGQLARAGKDFVTTVFHWESTTSRLEKLLGQ